LKAATFARTDASRRRTDVRQNFADLEAERLSPRVWRMACREEEIPTVGSFYAYDIV